MSCDSKQQLSFSGTIAELRLGFLLAGSLDIHQLCKRSLQGVILVADAICSVDSLPVMTFVVLVEMAAAVQCPTCTTPCIC